MIIFCSILQRYIIFKGTFWIGGARKYNWRDIPSKLMESDYENGVGVRSVDKSTQHSGNMGYRVESVESFSASSTSSECVYWLRENPSSTPKQSIFDRCGVRSVSMGSKYPRFLAYWPLAAVINEGVPRHPPRGCRHRPPSGLEFYLLYLIQRHKCTPELAINRLHYVSRNVYQIDSWKKSWKKRRDRYLASIDQQLCLQL